MTLDLHEVANGHYDFLNLLRKFTGGSKDERLTGFHVRVDLLEHGDRKGGSLSGT